MGKILEVNHNAFANITTLKVSDSICTFSIQLTEKEAIKLADDLILQLANEAEKKYREKL